MSYVTSSGLQDARLALRARKNCGILYQLSQAQTEDRQNHMQVAQFTRDMFRILCEKLELPYDIDEDGDYRLGLAADDLVTWPMRVYLVAAGSANDILDIRIDTTREFPSSEWGRAMLACNEWNDTTRWPKAYLHVNDPGATEPGKVVCEGSLDLENGIHQELLENYILTVIARSRAFWRWLKEEKGFI